MNKEKWYDFILLKLIPIVSFVILIGISVYLFNYYNNNNLITNYPNNYNQTLDSNFKLKEERLTPNEIGDSIGGTMSPIIGLMGVILTFLAFYIQYKANKQVQEQFKLQQFESQFYEMLRLHKENVKNLIYETEMGHFVFEKLYEELKKIEKNIMCTYKMEKSILISYEIFYNGVILPENHLSDIADISYSFTKQELIQKIEKRGTEMRSFQSYIHTLFKLKFFKDFSVSNISSSNIQYKRTIIKSKNSILSHYYRHLYQTVGMGCSK